MKGEPVCHCAEEVSVELLVEEVSVELLVEEVRNDNRRSSF